MQFGVVYLARAKGNRTRLLAVKTMKPGKVRLAASASVAFTCLDIMRNCGKSARCKSRSQTASRPPPSGSSCCGS